MRCRLPIASWLCWVHAFPYHFLCSAFTIKRDNVNFSSITSSPPFSVTRSSFLREMVAPASFASFFVANFLGNAAKAERAGAFDGGVGGLGKTKPNTGVLLLDEDSTPIQNAAGFVSAELNVNNKPVRVSFQAPWPLLGTASGLEARDLQQAESAFVQVVSGVAQVPTGTLAFRDLLIQSVFSQKGKFGAYGTPTDIEVKATEDANLFLASFTTLTPGLRESERQVWVKCVPVAGSVVLLVAGTTAARFKQRQELLKKVVDSFEAIPAPATGRLR